MNYLSVCSGIEAASVAWGPLGWKAAGFAEIDDYCRALLQHYYPEVPLHGDFTQIQRSDVGPIDLLVGGTPCQGFSIAGLRKGLGDARSNLALGYCLLADRLRPLWVAWENVPGAFTTSGEGLPSGDDFRSFVSALARWDVPLPKGGWQNSGIIEAAPVDGAYGLAWAVRDTQYIRVDEFDRAIPQRRRRIILVGYLGDWRRAAAVLFDTQSLRRDPPPCRRPGQSVAGPLGGSSQSGGFRTTDLDNHDAYIAEFCSGLDASGDRAGNSADDAANGQLLAFAENQRNELRELDAAGALASPRRIDPKNETLLAYSIQGAAGRENPSSGPDGVGVRDDGASYTLEARAEAQAVAFAIRGRDGGADVEVSGDVVNSIRAAEGGSSRDYVATEWAVRRLTPRECERLQGFPDDYTLIPFGRGMAADSRRYKALGNTKSVNKVRWLGRRIEMVEGLWRNSQ